MIKIIADQQESRKVASMLLTIGAIKLSVNDPFTWSSGWKSPIYCDNRLSLSYPEIRTAIKDSLVAQIKEEFPDVEAIAGVATAGIPQGALVADKMGLPFLYVRSKPKGHGMENLIEGKITSNQKIVLLEDLISTGGSSLKAAEALTQAGFEVMGMAAIFTYGFQVADDNFSQADIPLICLSDYNVLIKEALTQGIIQEIQLQDLKNWRLDPTSWSI